MPLNIKDSIDNLLVNVTQKQVDLWCEINKEKRISAEEFMKVFSDYTKEGLISLVVAFSMADKGAQDEEGDIEKAEVDKLGKYYNLIYNRLSEEGYNDEEIEEKIIDNVLNSKNIDILLKKEIMRMKEVPDEKLSQV